MVYKYVPLFMLLATLSITSWIWTVFQDWSPMVASDAWNYITHLQFVIATESA